MIRAQDLIVAADYGQIYIYSPDALDDPDICEAALDDATRSGRYVGVQPGFIDLMTPGQYNFSTPLRLEVWSADPPDDLSDWDHVVDADLDIPDGQRHDGPGHPGRRRGAACHATDGLRQLPRHHVRPAVRGERGCRDRAPAPAARR